MVDQTANRLRDARLGDGDIAEARSCDQDRLRLTSDATKGMCLGRCKKKGADCPVPDKSKQLSICGFSVKGTAELYCAWLCDYQGKKYKCPDNTNFDCKALTASSVVKYCVPK